MNPIVEPVWSWPITLTAAFVALALVLTTYRKRIAHLPAGSRRTLLTLRIFAWTILVFAMLRPALEYTDVDRRSSVFAFITDRSRSMGIADGPAGATRREVELKTIAGVKTELEALEKEIEVHHFEFDKELVPVENREPAAAGEQSAIGVALQDIVKQFPNKRIAAIVLLSDGAQRALPPHDVDPRTSARRLADLQVPVYTVGYGASGLSDMAVDLAMEDLEVSPTVFEKNTVVVSAKVRVLGAANRPLTVRLMLEDTRGTKPGEPSKMKLAAPVLSIRTALNQDILPVEMTFTPQQAGEFKLAMEVVPLEGEPLVTNNSLTTFITVLKGGISVAYFDAVRPEQKFIRGMNDSPDIRLDFKPIRSGALYENKPLEADWFQPGKYDVYIIGDVPAKVFGPESLRKLARTVEQGAGLMMTGGYHSFGPGGYADTPIADLLPVVMRPTEIQNEGPIDPSLHYLEPLQMLPTMLGLQHFVMRIESPDKNQEAWRQLAPLQGANKFADIKPLGLVLAETSRKVPLLVAQEVGKSRTIAFAADTTYQWVLAGQLESHQRFWQQTILWLAHKDVQGDNSVWLKLNARRFRPGQPVELTFGARDKDKQSIADAEFKVEIRGPQDQKEQLTPMRAGTDNAAKFINTQKPGEYVAHVEAKWKGNSLGMAAEARFIIYEQDLELHNPAADFSLLEEIARITAGKFLPPEDLGKFLREMIDGHKLNLEVKKVTRISLWDNWPLLVLFACVMTAEWFLRKKSGLV